MTEPQLLTRDQFREAVFARDRYKCVNCGEIGVDAHHIIERGLFEDGGYYTDNGVTLCSNCHRQAESTLIDCDTLRAQAGIQRVVLPSQLPSDARYDKWGNEILDNGKRLRGVFFDEAQKALTPVLHLFVNRVKYPKTYHLPWSPGITDEDRVLETTDSWIGMQVVITEKMDGECTTLYRDGLHARSVDSKPHPTRYRMKAIWAEIAHDIPEGWRVCGENMSAKHSIYYDDLSALFLVYTIWDGMWCLGWNETVEWAAMLGLHTVPILYWGEYTPEGCKAICNLLNPEKQEGLVVRPAGGYHFRDYQHVVGKYVRKGHVQTDEHWLRQEIVWNKVKP